MGLKTSICRLRRFVDPRAGRIARRGPRAAHATMLAAAEMFRGLRARSGAGAAGSLRRFCAPAGATATTSEGGRASAEGENESSGAGACDRDATAHAPLARIRTAPRALLRRRPRSPLSVVPSAQVKRTRPGKGTTPRR